MNTFSLKIRSNRSGLWYYVYMNDTKLILTTDLWNNFQYYFQHPKNKKENSDGDRTNSENIFYILAHYLTGKSH